MVKLTTGLTNFCDRTIVTWNQACCALVSVLSITACSEGGSNNPPDNAPTGEPVTQTSDDREVSVARQWNEIVLLAIREDFARPTVHARNLFHSSAAMFDAWALFDANAEPFLLTKQVGGYDCPLDYQAFERDTVSAQEQAISYAAYRLIVHRFVKAPGYRVVLNEANALMGRLGYDTEDTNTDTTGGSAAAIGNRIAGCYIGFGLRDGANETNAYVNTAYQPVNPPIEPDQPGNPTMLDRNRWQPISLTVFIDQSGNRLNEASEFLGAEWGQVLPFALSADDLTLYRRNGFNYYVYHDPGSAPLLAGPLADQYQWGYALVAAWSAHLDPADGVLMDVSPASLGNSPALPTQASEYGSYYDFLNGGDAGTGYPSNPKTGQPYVPQIVPRADYARVVAEYWADGPDSETPPGHWFVILNTIQEHPLFERRLTGSGPMVGPLQWDVKAYLALGGAMHDAAITAWGIKGWYDSPRPLSAIRAMADRGQSSDPGQASFAAQGLPLTPGVIEVVAPGDPLAGANNEHVGKLKLRAWRGPNAISNARTDQAGVAWILAEQWWPYQRPTFVSPPFAGYVSGHSTFSAAAAEVLEALTGDPYFPGGMSSVEMKANEFLVFEDGPSVDLSLQWATYRDASDQASLSRLWGGIHPPADDIPGRIIGRKIGVSAFTLAQQYFGDN